MKTFIIDAKILDPEEVNLNLYINAHNEQEALNFLNTNYNVIIVTNIGVVE